MTLSPFAGKPAPAELLVDIPRLVTAYYTGQPDASVPTQRVAFGTSGHRGSSFDLSFNEWHVLAISQAICLYRESQGIDGPLFVGIDTHALSTPAGASALEVLAANGVTVMIAAGDEYTPTPAVSHAILRYNRGRTSGLADGIVITPSHNPPQSGGYKYNPTNGGPADTHITKWIEAKANELLAAHSGRDRWSLSRDFRLLFGTSPYRYLSMRHLDLVRALLVQGQTLANAALIAGFTDQSHMTRQFRQTYGLPPARWLKMLGR